MLIPFVFRTIPLILVHYYAAHELPSATQNDVHMYTIMLMAVFSAISIVQSEILVLSGILAYTYITL